MTATDTVIDPHCGLRLKTNIVQLAVHRLPSWGQELPTMATWLCGNSAVHYGVNWTISPSKTSLMKKLWMVGKSPRTQSSWHILVSERKREQVPLLSSLGLSKVYLEDQILVSSLSRVLGGNWGFPYITCVLSTARTQSSRSCVHFNVAGTRSSSIRMVHFLLKY